MALQDDIIAKIAQLGPLKDAAMKKLSAMCTTVDMDNANVSYPEIKEMEYWADMIAMRQNTAGGPYLVINKEDDPLHPVVEGFNGTPTTVYLTETVPGEDGNQIERVVSEIVYEERAWNKMGWVTHPTVINHAFDQAKNLVSELRLGVPEKWSSKFENNGEILFFPNLKELGISTANVVNFSKCFYNSGTTNLPDEFETDSAQSIGSMFCGCEKITRLPEMKLANARTGSGYSLMSKPEGIFSNCNNLEDASGVTGLGESEECSPTLLHTLFANDKKLKKLPGKIDCSHTDDFGNLLNGCGLITDARCFDGIGENSSTYNTTYCTMKSAFEGCKSLRYIPKINLSNYHITSRLFYGCEKLEEITLSGCMRHFVDATNTAYNNMKDMFYGCVRLKKLKMCGIDSNNQYIQPPSLTGCNDLVELIFASNYINEKVVMGLVTTIPAYANRTVDGAVKPQDVVVRFTAAAYETLRGFGQFNAFNELVNNEDNHIMLDANYNFEGDEFNENN